MEESKTSKKSEYINVAAITMKELTLALSAPFSYLRYVPIYLCYLLS